MSNSYLDPKLYEAVRRGKETYIKEHGLISEEERDDFENAANDPGHVALNIPEEPEGPSGPGPEGRASPEPEGPSSPGPEGPAAPPEPEGPSGPGPEGRAASEPEGLVPDPENQHPLLRVTCAGDTVLHIATQFGQTNLAKKICRVRACASLLTTVNDKWETPLHYAAQAGNHDLVVHFIRIGRDEHNNIDLGELLRERNKEGETALYQAVRHQHKDVVEKLLEVYPNLACNVDDNNISPLYLATKLRSLPIVTTLVQRMPLNVPQESYCGPERQTALHEAAISTREGFVRMVLWRKPELTRATDNLAGWTPLHYAASVNNYRAAIMLLEQDRSAAYIPGSGDLYPVHVAAKLGHREVLIELCKQCPDSDQLLDSQGRNFVHMAVLKKRPHILQLICKTSKFEKAMNAQDDQGNTPLHLAVEGRDMPTFTTMMLSKRVHLNWLNKNGASPLDIARAQRKDGFTDYWQNPDYVIYRTLSDIERDLQMHKTSGQLTVEENQEKDEEKEKKEVESYESMAKSMAIGSVLIAAAAFAAALTIYGLYNSNKDTYKARHLKPAFMVFVFMDAYAFLCAIIATAWLVEAALPFLDPSYRKGYLLKCAALVMMAAKGFIIAFATAAFVVLTPISKALAIVVCASTGVIGTVLLQPHHWPNLSVLKIVIKYKGWRGYFGTTILEWARFCLGTFLYTFIVLLLLTSESFSHWSSGLILTILSFVLVGSSYIPLFAILAERFKKKDALKYHTS